MRYLAPYAAVTTLSWTAFSLKWQPVLPATTDWDGQHFLAIAQYDYPRILLPGYSNIAFFPGMPIAVRLVHLVGPSWRLSGFIVSILAGAMFCLCGGLLVARRYGEAAGRRAAALLAVAPGAFLFGLSYADPLALALVAGALLMLEGERWGYAGVLGALATATSPVVMPIVLVAVWVVLTRYWERARPSGLAWLAPAIMPVGFVAFMADLWLRTGQPDVWFRAQAKGWGQGFYLLSWLREIRQSTDVGVPITVGASMFLALLGCYAMYRARVPIEWWMYSVAVICVGLFSSGSVLNPRVLLNAFPLTLAAAVKVKGRWFAVLFVVSLAAMQLALVAYLYVWPNNVGQP